MWALGMPLRLCDHIQLTVTLYEFLGGLEGFGSDIGCKALHPISLARFKPGISSNGYWKRVYLVYLVRRACTLLNYLHTHVITQDPAQGLFCNLNCMLWFRLVGGRSRASLNVVPMEPSGPGEHSCKFIAKPGAGKSISSAVF